MIARAFSAPRHGVAKISEPAHYRAKGVSRFCFKVAPAKKHGGGWKVEQF